METWRMPQHEGMIVKVQVVYDGHEAHIGQNQAIRALFNSIWPWLSSCDKKSHRLNTPCGVLDRFRISS